MLAFSMHLVYVLYTVLILSPWEEKTYIPRDFASLTFICSGEEDNNLEWSVFLVGRQASSHFDFESSIKLLNDHGFYEVRRTVPVPEEELQMNNSIQLLINNTEGNNGTLVKCFDAGTSPTLHQTTIIITGKTKQRIQVENVMYHTHTHTHTHPTKSGQI
jgi:hypothetical protein